MNKFSPKKNYILFILIGLIIFFSLYFYFYINNESFENNEFLNNSIFICYSTPNYDTMTSIFLDSLKKITSPDKIIHKLDTPPEQLMSKSGFQTDLWYYCVTSKISHLVDILFKSNNYYCKYFIFTDCDIRYISKNKTHWESLKEFIDNNNNDIFFMRENESTDVNSGFFIIKNNENLNNVREFFINVLNTILVTSKKEMPFGDQSIINNMKQNINYGFIPNEYVIFGENINDEQKSLFHHAVGVSTIDDKLNQINNIMTIVG